MQHCDAGKPTTIAIVAQAPIARVVTGAVKYGRAGGARAAL
jgi:hypothetical protein